MINVPVIKDVLLVGGGHSHVLFIRTWAMQPIPGVRLTLVSEKVDTPYSGMLPGLIAGHYTEEEVHIDLARLCSWASVRFIEQRVTSINLDVKTVAFDSTRPDLDFDVLSLDTGSTPELSVPGSDQFSVPVKPVHGFYSRWQLLLSRLHAHTEGRVHATPVNVGVIGSGAGGFELIMAMRHTLPNEVANCHWFIRGERGLKGRPEKVAQAALQAAKDANVVVHLNFDVVDVLTDSVQSRDGRTVSLDEIIWCAAAKAPSWPKDAGFSVDSRGFVLTNAFLQSVSHEYVFATGDIGTQKATPSDKAGVFAVRQAPFLFQNIRRFLLNKKLKPYKPQSDFLSLMATGKKSAIGNRGPVCVQGTWVWRCKDWIDRKFMNQFQRLPDMPSQSKLFTVPQALLENSHISVDDVAGAHMRCRGCGGKVGASILDSVLNKLSVHDAQGIVSGLEQSDDAAVIKNSAETLVQSVDKISALCADHYVFGRIATVHALSDIYTSGGNAHSAQVMVDVPFADHVIVQRDLNQLMAGVVDALNNEQCALIGGHTAESTDLSLGLVVNSFRGAGVRSSADVNPGDCLILTKPLGTGILLAGMMRQNAKGSDVQKALDGMQRSNRLVAEVLYEHGVKVATDITGFGLLGHMQRLLEPISAGAVIKVSQVPLYSGALVLAEQGTASTLLSQNQQVLEHIAYENAFSEAWLNLLCDPQTSGGLLGIVSAAQSEALIDALQTQGCETAQIIGTISQTSSIQLQL